MKLYHWSEMTLKQKEASVRSDFDVGDDTDLINRLFFAAKNGAIVAICRDVEHYFADRGLRILAEWSESSYGNLTSLNTTLKDKADHRRIHFITREKLWPITGAPSDMIYSLKSVQTGEHYSRVKPKKAIDYDAILGSDDFRKFLENQILRANYPFGYSSHSSF